MVPLHALCLQSVCNENPIFRERVQRKLKPPQLSSVHREIEEGVSPEEAVPPSTEEETCPCEFCEQQVSFLDLHQHQVRRYMYPLLVCNHHPKLTSYPGFLNCVFAESLGTKLIPNYHRTCFNCVAK